MSVVKSFEADAGCDVGRELAALSAALSAVIRPGNSFKSLKLTKIGLRSPATSTRHSLLKKKYLLSL